MLDKTRIINTETIEDALINEMLHEVIDALEEKGYKPINQLLGYFMSGDPGYISSYKGARDKITRYDRAKVLMCVLEGYLNKWNI